MKRWHRVLVSVLTVCLSELAAVAALAEQAQSPGASRATEATARLYVLQAVATPLVQQELKLTDQQLATMAEVRSSLSRSTREPEGRAKALAEAAKKVESVLTQEQVSRLRQIHLQSLHTHALLLPEVISALGLTEDQQKRLEAIDAKLSSQRQSVNKDLSREERRARWPQLVKQALDEANAVLTPSQREAFAKMRGADLDFSARALPASGYLPQPNRQP